MTISLVARRGSRQAGFTLAELTIYMFILALLMTAMYSMLQIGLTTLNSTQASAELQGDCITAMDHLSGELSESDPTTVQVGTAGISFASPRDSLDSFILTNGSLMWQKFICYYLDSSNPGVLVRKEKSITPTSTAPVSLLSAFTPAQFVSMAVPAHRLGANITSISCTLTGPQASLTLIAQKRAGGALILDRYGSPMHEIQLTSNVLIRN